MLVVTRFRVSLDDADFRADLDMAHEALADRPGYVEGQVGRNVDEPDLWVLVTRWENVGAYRRALSNHYVKMRAVPVLYRAVDEPSAYELATPDADLNTRGARSLG